MPYTYNQSYEVYDKGVYVTNLIGPCPVHPSTAVDQGPYSILDHHYKTEDTRITCFTHDYVIQLFSDASDYMFVWYNPKTVEKYVAKDLLENTSSNSYFTDDALLGMHACLFERKYTWSKQIDAAPYILSVCIQDKKLKKQFQDAKNCSCKLRSMSLYNTFVFDLYLNECVEECMAKYEEQKALSEMHLNIHALPYVPSEIVQKSSIAPIKHTIIHLKRSDKKKRGMQRLPPILENRPLAPTPIVVKPTPIVAKGPPTSTPIPIVAKGPPIVAKGPPIVAKGPPALAKAPPAPAKGPPAKAQTQTIHKQPPTSNHLLFETPYIYNKETIKLYHAMIKKTLKKCRRN